MPQADMNDWTGGHPDEGLLHEWLEEQLPAATALHIEAHVVACSGCAARVAEARGLIAASHRILTALDDVPAHVIPVAPVARPKPYPQYNRWRRWGQVAAVLVVAVAGGSYWFKGDAVKTSVRDVGHAAPVGEREAAGRRGALALATTQPQLADSISPTGAAEQEAAPSRTKSRAVAKAQDATPVDPARRARSAPVAVTATGKASVSLPTSTPALRLPSPARAPVPTVPSLSPPRARPPASPAPVAAAPIGSALPFPPPGTAVAGGVAGVTASRATGVGGAERVAADQVATSSNAAGGGRGGSDDRGGTGGRPVQRADTLRAADARAFAATVPVAPAPASESRAATGAARLRLRGGAALDGRVAFDSVTVIRRVCGTTCETTTLHVTAAGAVRYAVGTGNTQRVVMSQLSIADRTQSDSLLLRTFGPATPGAGTTVCSTGDGPRGAALEVIVAPRSIAAASASGCAVTGAQLTEFGASVNALVRVETLRGRVPPER